jgi:ADP-glucose type glycogen/starch synthase
MHRPEIPTRPRILIVTPEITRLPAAMGEEALGIRAKAGGLGDATASLVAGLVRQGADVHVALPNYRRLFRQGSGDLPDGGPIHLADDPFFHRHERIYHDHRDDAMHAALAFQREVIHRILPRVRPDLVHCNDWMSALVPAAARSRGIRSVFSLHNIHDREVTLDRMWASGIDPRGFWQHLYFDRPPGDCEHARWHLPVHSLASGVFAADHLNTVSPGFLQELAEGRHEGIAPGIRPEILGKLAVGRASGILNAPDPSYDPATDPAIRRRFSSGDHAAGKTANKLALQHELGLDEDPEAPVFFWPSRLDPFQKGPELLSDVLHRTVSEYWDRHLQVVVVADGPHQECLRWITDAFSLHRRVAIRGFDERLARLAYAASDFMLMPSRFEPCGLPQMIAPLYGCLPVVHATGGLRDTVRHLDVAHSAGNGCRFEDADSNGLRWAIDEAMRFHALPAETRARELKRIMAESRERFDPVRFIRAYRDLYETLLECPLVPAAEPAATPAPAIRRRKFAPPRMAGRPLTYLPPRSALPAV